MKFKNESPDEYENEAASLQFSKDQTKSQGCPPEFAYVRQHHGSSAIVTLHSMVHSLANSASRPLMLRHNLVDNNWLTLSLDFMHIPICPNAHIDGLVLLEFNDIASPPIWPFANLSQSFKGEEGFDATDDRFSLKTLLGESFSI
ncbi:hypothetical protein Fot_24141 [Forsythia ovata]|uniref:Uncharacterized protein n=1 Tax=Forsythia ovata TaxID=205694 RepID=A0ABD1U6F4_9LAMI